MDLLSLRTERGLTLAQTCVELGLKPGSKGWISEIERGTKEASVRLALRIEDWSGGKVPAGSVCKELAGRHGSAPSGESGISLDQTSSVTVENGGASQ